MSTLSDRIRSYTHAPDAINLGAIADEVESLESDHATLRARYEAQAVAMLEVIGERDEARQMERDVQAQSDLHHGLLMEACDERDALAARLREVEAGAAGILARCRKIADEALTAYGKAERDSFDEGAAHARRDTANEIAEMVSTSGRAILDEIDGLKAELHKWRITCEAHAGALDCGTYQPEKCGGQCAACVAEQCESLRAQLAESRAREGATIESIQTRWSRTPPQGDEDCPSRVWWFRGTVLDGRGRSIHIPASFVTTTVVQRGERLLFSRLHSSFHRLCDADGEWCPVPLPMEPGPPVTPLAPTPPAPPEPVRLPDDSETCESVVGALTGRGHVERVCGKEAVVCVKGRALCGECSGLRDATIAALPVEGAPPDSAADGLAEAIDDIATEAEQIAASGAHGATVRHEAGIWARRLRDALTYAATKEPA